MANRANLKKTEKKYPRLRVFCTTAMLTFCLLLLGAGFLIADYNTRRMGFNDGSLRVEIKAQKGEILFNLLGRERAIEVSETTSQWAGRVWTMLSPGVRTALWIFEGECEAVPSLLEWAGK